MTAASPMQFDETLAEIEVLGTCHPAVIAQRLGVQPASIARTLWRHGMPEMARKFNRAQKEWVR